MKAATISRFQSETSMASRQRSASRRSISSSSRSILVGSVGHVSSVRVPSDGVAIRYGSSDRTVNGIVQSSRVAPSMVSRHSYRPGSSGSGVEFTATGKSSGVPGFSPGGRPTSNSPPKATTWSESSSPSKLIGSSVRVEELHREGVTRVRLIPRHLNQEADTERCGLRAGLRPASPDDRELAVRDDGVVGEQHRGFHAA